MTIDMDGNGIRFVRKDGLVAWYEVMLQEITVMRISVNEGDHALPIIVWQPSQTSTEFIVTPGKARMALHSYGEGEDIKVDEHVDNHSIHEYIYPRLGYLLTLLASPSPATEAALKKMLNIV